jgi:hypothetical protein
MLKRTWPLTLGIAALAVLCWSDSMVARLSAIPWEGSSPI